MDDGDILTCDLRSTNEGDVMGQSTRFMHRNSHLQLRWKCVSNNNHRIWSSTQNEKWMLSSASVSRVKSFYFHVLAELDFQFGLLMPWMPEERACSYCKATESDDWALFASFSARATCVCKFATNRLLVGFFLLLWEFFHLRQLWTKNLATDTWSIALQTCREAWKVRIKRIFFKLHAV